MAHIRITNPPKDKMPKWAWAMVACQLLSIAVSVMR